MSSLLDYIRSKQKVPFSGGPFTIGAQVQYQNSRSALDTIIRRELLPALVQDIKGADQFAWTWHGFTNTVRGAIGTVLCKPYNTSEVRQRTFTISRDILDRALLHSGNPHQLQNFVSMIDVQLESTMRDIMATFLPPHDIKTCNDPECPC